MEYSTRDKLVKKMLDAQENVRDYKVFSRQTKDPEVSKYFAEFAEESGLQARKIKELLSKYETETQER